MESRETNQSSPEEHTHATVNVDEAVRDVANGHGVLKSRSPTTLLHDVIQGMTTTQKNVVAKMGFKSVLDLHIREIPTNLAYYVVSQLNTEEMVIRTPHGNIPVNREAVHEVYGFPMGTTILERTRMANSNNETMIKAWREHLGLNEDVRPQRLADKMMPRKAVDFMFKLDFLVLMVSTLVQTMANGRVYLRYFRSITENSEFKEFDWCKFVVDAAKECRDGWKPHSKFVGPLAFLVLLYCDRVSVAPAIERVRPVITKWESQDLKEREENEKACGFGSCELLPAWRETASGMEYLERISALCLEKDVHFSGCGCTKEEDDVGEGVSEQTEESVVEEITRLLEKARDLAQTKLDDAVSHFGATEKLQSIKDNWNSTFSEQLFTHDAGYNSPFDATSSLTRSAGLPNSMEETQPLVDPLCRASTYKTGPGTIEQPIEVHSTIRRVRVCREEEELTRQQKSVIFLLSDDEESQETENLQEEILEERIENGDRLRRLEDEINELRKKVQGLQDEEERRRVEAENVELRKQIQHEKEVRKTLQHEIEQLKNYVEQLGKENSLLDACFSDLDKLLSNDNVDL